MWSLLWTRIFNYDWILNQALFYLNGVVVHILNNTGRCCFAVVRDHENTDRKDYCIQQTSDLREEGEQVIPVKFMKNFHV